MALHAPAVPISLVQEWVQSAYDQLCGRRHWAWLKRETILTTRASRSFSATFTQGSTTVASAGQFLSTDVGRQIRAGANTPVYTINTFTTVNAVELTQAYAETGGAKTSTVQDVYLIMPADFRSIYTVTDLTIQRPIAWWISQERLDLFDPARISSDSRFRVLASAHLSQVTSLLGRVLYEAWPYPTAVGSYGLSYFIRTDALVDDTALTGVIATWPEVLKKGALAKAALWPGTEGRKNPYFNLTLAARLEDDFNRLAKTLDVMDDDQYLADLQQIDLSKFGLAALSADTTLMRQSDATLADYY